MARLIAAVSSLMVVGCVLGMLLMQRPAQAYIAPRPTVELVKTFACNVGDNGSKVCAERLENEANGWLQKAQPGVRILERQLAATRYSVFLAIFYEVQEWRVKAPEKRMPAEAPK